VPQQNPANASVAPLIARSSRTQAGLSSARTSPEPAPSTPRTVRQSLGQRISALFGRISWSQPSWMRLPSFTRFSFSSIGAFFGRHSSARRSEGDAPAILGAPKGGGPVAQSGKLPGDGESRKASASFQEVLQSSINDAVKDGVKKLTATGVDFDSFMARDFGRCTFVVNGDEASGPRLRRHGNDDGAVRLVPKDEQEQNARATLLNASIPEAHLAAVSQIHQGMFAEFTALMGHRDDAPFPNCMFGFESGEELPRTAGTRFEISATGRPGVYTFKASTEKCLNFVTLMPGVDGRAPEMIRLDPFQSVMRLEIEGELDVAGPDVTLTKPAIASYYGVPAAQAQD
jgi:hypothetical protein